MDERADDPEGVTMQDQDRKSAGKDGPPPPGKMDALAEKREAALKGLRARIRNHDAQPRNRSKRIHRANLESRQAARSK